MIHFELDSGRLRWPEAIADTRQHVYMSKWQTFAKVARQGATGKGRPPSQGRAGREGARTGGKSAEDET